jgi:hypothetical protein
MRPFKYNPPRVHTGELRTRVNFYEFVPIEGPMPGEVEKKILYTAWAKIDSVWMKDLEVAKSNGTLSDVTITIRNPFSDYVPGNDHYLSIDAPEYQNKRYNIEHVQPDFQNTGFITIVAGLSS